MSQIAITIPIVTLLVFLELGVASSAQAQRTLTLQIGRRTVSCTSGGRPVWWVANPGLNDVGFTRASSLNFAGTADLEIEYNPRTLFSMQPDLALFWLGHECGHAYNRTSDESTADCWSAKMGVKQNWFNASDFAQLVEDMKNNPGDATHPPGDERTALIKTCMAQAENGTTADTGGLPDNPIVVPHREIPDYDEEASKCVFADERHIIITWNLPSHDQVKYRLDYMSTCDRPVSCRMRIATGTSDGTGFHSFKETLKSVTIPAHGDAWVEGSLQWYTDDPRHRDLLYSDKGQGRNFKTFCKFTP